MSAQQANQPHEMPDVQGHTMGFVNTPAALEGLTDALTAAGFSRDRIMTFSGQAGLQSLQEMLGDSQWGEIVEKFLKQGTAELQLGHSIVCVEVGDEQEAARVAEISTRHGGHSFVHFGLVVDTQLTA